MAYDGDGNRVSETAGTSTTKYLIDDLNPTGYAEVLDELVGSSVTRTYAYGLQRISEDQLVSGNWTPSFYGYDGHGNARFLANSAGTITDTYTFDAFGAPIASTGTTPNAYLYSGERFDSSLNLYHLRARYYNMLTGRFETMDPAVGKITDPATLHRYAYAKNNPANAIDPTGQGALLEFLADLWEARESFIFAARLGCYTVTASTLVFEVVGLTTTGSFPNPGIPYWVLTGPCAAVTVFFPPTPPGGW